MIATYEAKFVCPFRHPDYDLVRIRVSGDFATKQQAADLIFRKAKQEEQSRILKIGPLRHRCRYCHRPMVYQG